MEELDDEHRKQLIVDIVQIVSKQVPIATDTDQIERQLCRSSTTLMNLPLLLEIETTHPPSSKSHHESTRLSSLYLGLRWHR